MSDSKTRRSLPPMLILAAPAGTYTLIRFAPEWGWQRAGEWALLVLTVALFAPQLLVGAGKVAAHLAKPKPKKKAKKKDDD